MDKDEAQQAIVAGRLAMVRARYPDRFNDEDLAQIEKRIARSVGQAAKMRDVPLGNGNGPFFSPVTRAVRRGDA
jgi:hypothetical protein